MLSLKCSVPKSLSTSSALKKVKMKLKHIISTDLKLASMSDLVSSLLETMQDSKISSVVITDSSNHPVGIFTEFDAIKIVASGIDISLFKAKDIINNDDLFVLDENTDIYKAFDIMQTKHYRHIIAVDYHNKITGVATQSDFLKYLDSDLLVKLKIVSDVMTKNVITITPQYSIHDAAAIMLHHKISSLIVVNDESKPVGILTERDMVKQAKDKQKMTIIKDVMSVPLVTIKHNEQLSSCIITMENFNIRRLVVVDENDMLCGIITRFDILKSLQTKKIEILSHTIKQKNLELDIIKKQDEELKLLDIALKSSANAVVITDNSAQIKWCNHAFEELTGYNIKEIIGQKPKDLTKSGVQTKEFYEILWSTILSKKSWKGEIVNKKKDGTLYNEKLTITPILDENNNITHFVVIKEDITNIKNMQKSLVESETRFKSLFQNAPLPYQSLDQNGHILEVNQAWIEFSGYEYDDVIGQFIGKYLKAPSNSTIECYFQKLLLEDETRGEVFEFVTKYGMYKTVEVNGKTSIDLTSGKKFTHCLLHDITEKKLMQDKIHYIAHYDLLTQLPNKVSLNEEMHHAIFRANRNQTKIALFVLGIDSFKDINDSFGHAIGDELLILVSNELINKARESDFIARVAGDEFAIIVENIINDEDCAHIATKFIDAVNKTWYLSNGVTVYLSATVGISLYPQNGIDAQKLLQHSDAALYLAKKENRGKFRFYNNDITVQARNNLQTISKLKESISNQEFIVLYQPQVCIKSGKIIGAESLVRWQQTSAIVNPKEFINLAEERGLISYISDMVLNQTCIDTKKFLQISDIKVSINISTTEINNLTLEKFQNYLNQHLLLAKNIGIEVTESIFIKNINNAIDFLNKFKSSGFLISLDDFGTGYSSLSYLKKLPLDILKIDKSFIDGITTESDDKQITKTIISMAKTLGLKVLAEGIETKEQLEFLRNEGCDYYQGYYFSKPISALEFIELLKKDNECVA